MEIWRVKYFGESRKYRKTFLNSQLLKLTARQN